MINYSKSEFAEKDLNLIPETEVGFFLLAITSEIPDGVSLLSKSPHGTSHGLDIWKYFIIIIVACNYIKRN